MDVSVIIINYNTKQLTLNCIESVFSSKTKYSYEIIMVDNASTDGTVSSVRELFPDVSVIENNQNIGFARANNQAAEIAAGRYLYILNSDTEIEDDVIEKVVSYGDVNHDVGIIGTKAIFPDGKLYTNFYRFQTFYSEFIFFTIGLIKTNNWSIFHSNKYKTFPLNEPMKVDVITGCSLFVKRTVYNKIGLFNEQFFMYYEDGEFCYRVKKHGFKSIYLPTSCITHIHKGSVKDNPDNFSILVACFKSAVIYISNIHNHFYAWIFKNICYVIWFHELVLMKVGYVITKKNKVKRKLDMLHALLNG